MSYPEQYTSQEMSILCILMPPNHADMWHGQTKRVYEYAKHKHINVVDFPSKEWQHMTATEAKADLERLEAAGWVEAKPYKNRVYNQHVNKNLWHLEADHLASVPNVTRDELLLNEDDLLGVCGLAND